MKVLRKAAVIQSNSVTHVLSERAILARLQHHPYCCSLVADFQTEHKLCFVCVAK
jgi:hypothetical protein